jgi:hypothetical protein
MSLLRPTIALLALALAASCVLDTYHMASLPDQGVEITSPELSRLYVLRKERSAGNLRRMFVFDDEAQIGSLNEDEFVCWERRPGHIRLSVFYERPKSEGGNLQFVAEFETAAGEVSYHAIVVDDEHTKLTIERVGVTDGRAMVAERYAPQTL